MKKKNKKLLLIISIILITGLIAWSMIVYLSIAFILAEINPFNWTQESRGLHVLFTFLYVVLSPILYFELKEEFGKV